MKTTLSTGDRLGGTRSRGGGLVTAPSWNPPVTPHVRMWQGRPQFRRRLMTPWPKPLTLCGAEATAHDVLRSDLPRIKRAGEVDRVCGLCMEQA